MRRQHGAWLESERREIRAAERGVSAHSNAHVAQVVHQAVDQALGQADHSDVYSALFPPSAPLGPPEDDDDTGPGAYMPTRPPAVQQSASAGEPLSDEELFIRLYGRKPRPGELEDDD